MLEKETNEDNLDDNNADENINDKKLPKNWSSVSKMIKSSNVRKPKIHTDDLLIYTVAFNMKGNKPNKNDLKLLLKRDKPYNMYVIGSEECMRSILMSFFYDNKDEWVNMIK